MDSGHVEVAARDMVEQTPRSSHDDVGHRLQGIYLVGHVVAAIEGHRLKAGRHRADYIGNLNHQFARGSYYNSLEHTLRRAESAEQTDGKSRRFSRTGRRKENQARGVGGSHELLHRVEGLYVVALAEALENRLFIHNFEGTDTRGVCPYIFAVIYL